MKLCSLKPTTGLDPHYRYFSRSAQKRKDVLKLQKFQNSKTAYSFLRLQAPA